MRRLIAITVVACLALAALVVGIAAKPGKSTSYKVDVIFDTAANLIPGSNVQVAGTKVGTVKSIDLTPEHKAKVEIEIVQPGIAPFRTDASCFIGVASLIGEMYVQCKPGSSAAPELMPESGQKEPTVALEHTTTPVPVDYVMDTWRGSASQRLRILLMEFGIGVAGRGQDINAILRRSNPALLETNRVLKILARQNTQLRDLASSADQIFSALAGQRGHVANAIVQINKTAQATAARRDQIAEGIKRLPALLRQLRPTMQQLGEYSDQTTPILADFHSVAPDFNRFATDLGPFATESIPSLKSLGQFADKTTPVLQEADPLIKKLDALTTAAVPGSSNLNKLLSDVRDSGGIERLMDLLLYVGGASSPFDSVGHYVVSRLIANTCVQYATAGMQQPNCSAQIKESSKSKSTQAAPSSAASGGAKTAAVSANGNRSQRQPTAASQGKVLDYLLGK